MIEKCKYSIYTALTMDTNSSEVIDAVVCGANIKPITSKIKDEYGSRYMRRKITKWGVFIHLRLPNGDQYDFITEFGKTMTTQVPSFMRIHDDFDGDLICQVPVDGSEPIKDFDQEYENERFKYGIPYAYKKKGKKKKSDYEETIPMILRACGVNEWVELIGANVKIKPIRNQDGDIALFGLSPVDGIFAKWFFPDYFEIFPGMHASM